MQRSCRRPGLLACLALLLPLTVLGGGCQPAPENAGAPGTDRYGDPLSPGALTRLGAARFVQPEPVHRLAVLDDGKAVVSVAAGGSNPGDTMPVRLWDTATGQLPCTYQLVGGTRFHARLSPDGRRAYLECSFPVQPEGGGAAETCEGVDVVEVATGKRLRRLGLRVDSSVGPFAVSPDEKVLAVRTSSRRQFPPEQVIALWDAETGEELWSSPEGEKGADEVGQVEFSREGRILGTFRGNTIRLREVRTGKETQRLEAVVKTGKRIGPGLMQRPISSRVNGLWFSSTGGVLAYTESLYQDIHLCDLVTGKEIRHLPGGFTALAFSPDDRYLAAVAYYLSQDEWAQPRWGDVHVWETATGKEVARFGREYLAACLAFGPDGRTLFTGGRDGKIRRWSLPEGELVAPAEGHASGVWSVVFSPDGLTLASLGDSICLWDVKSGRPVRRFGQECYRGDPDKVPQTTPPPRWFPGEAKVGLRALAFRAGGERLVTWGWDEVFRHWDRGSGKDLRQARRDPELGTLFENAFSPEGTTLAAYFENGGLCLLDPETGKQKARWEGVVPQALAFSDDGKVLAAAYESTGGPRVGLWDVAEGRKRASFDARGLVGSLALSADGGVFAAVIDDRAILVWDVAAGEVVRVVSADRETVCRLSPDGKLLAFAHKGGSDIVLWDVAAGEERRRLAGHVRAVYSLAFAPDGRKLASGSSDGTVLLWDLGGG